MKTVYNTENIKLIGMFNNITKANVKELLFINEEPVFIINQGELGKALGKNKSNLFRIENLLKKKIKIVEYSESSLQFLLNLLFPIKVADLKEEDNIIFITPKDTKTRGFIIGRNAQNLRLYESIMKKYFPNIVELKVI